MAYRTKHLVEYGLLRGTIFLLNLLPLRVALALGWLLAAASYGLAGKKVREARRRMRAVFGPKVSESQIRHWTWRAWRNLFFNAVEVARASRLTREEVTKRIIHYESVEKLNALHSREGGFILAVCHMGNWDLAGFSARLLGLPLFVLVRGQSNPLVTHYLERIRDHFQFGWVDRHRALGSILKRIKTGEVFTILPDVRAKTRESAVLVPFLGGTAYLMAGTGLFARLSGRPVITAILSRRGWTRHEWNIGEPIYPELDVEREADIQRMTFEVMRRFDEAVRNDPEQYFWFNKRWVLDDRF